MSDALEDPVPAGQRGLPTILVVEDEPLVRMFACDVLEDSGYNVLVAANAREALALALVCSDLAALFTDIDMPGDLDGIALARRLAQEKPGIPVLVTSGVGLVGRELPPGARFLGKPYSASRLLDLLSKVLDRPTSS